MKIIDDNAEDYAREMRITYEPPQLSECMKDLTPFTVRVWGGRE